MLSAASKKDIDRWYALKPIPQHINLINSTARYNVVAAGRRSGKTERFKRRVVKAAFRYPGMYFAGAPTRDQAKKIFWEDLKLLTLSSAYSKDAINRSDLIINIPNGSSIHVLGLDRPERFEGIPWMGGGIDEVDELKKHAWPEHISPALNTVDPRRPEYRAWCWLFGVPAGLQLLYEKFEYARTANDPLWAAHHWLSSELLTPEDIEAAKRDLSPMQFRQEYEASFETATGRIYGDYNDDNITDEEIMDHEELLWTHDINFTPLSSAIAVRRDNDIKFLDEIVLNSAVGRQSAEEFCDKFKSHGNKRVTLFGDPSGKQGEKHGQNSHYIEIETVLRMNGWKVERAIRNKAPAIKDRQNAMRAKVRNAAGDVSLHVNPRKAKYCHESFKRCTLKEGSTFLEEDSEYQHISTACGYLVERIWPIRIDKEVKKVTPIPTVHHWRG